MSAIFILSILLLASSPTWAQDVPTPAPAEMVLPIPPSEACGPQVFHDLTFRYRTCSQAFFNFENPDMDCCEGMAYYYGSNTTRPSANCFCNATLWADFISYQSLHYYPFASAFQYCAYRGFIIPYNEEEGAGYCYGVPPDEETLAGAFVEGTYDAPIASTKEYMKKMHNDHLVTFAFATSIVSGVGCLFLLWPLMWEAAMSLTRS